MEIQKNVQKWGNSAGVLLPREWLGKEVQIILIDRTTEIKKEIFEMLDPFLSDIIGIYLTGSYARNEQREDSDIDIIAISNSTKKQIKSGKYDISIIALNSVKKTIKKNPILIVPRLMEAKSLLNNSLLEELKNIRINQDSFKSYLQETKRMIKINEEFLNLDKMQKKEFLDSIEIIYSLILRLRGIFLIKKILNKQAYSKKSFLKFLETSLDKEEIDKVYKVYKSIRDGTKIKEKIKIETAIKLIDLLKKYLKWLKEKKD